MTHPFHPLCGHEFELIEYRQAWGEHRVYFLDASEQLQRLPASWTNIVAEDSFVAVAAGRSPLRVAELEQLVDLISQLRQQGDM